MPTGNVQPVTCNIQPAACTLLSVWVIRGQRVLASVLGGEYPCAFVATIPQLLVLPGWVSVVMSAFSRVSVFAHSEHAAVLVVAVADC